MEVEVLQLLEKSFGNISNLLIVIFGLRLITFLKSSYSEKKLTSLELEIVTHILFYIYIFLFIPCLITYEFYNWFYDFASKININWLFISFFLISTINYFIGKYSNLKIVKLKRQNQKHNNKKIFIFALYIITNIINLLLCILTAIYIGLAHSEIISLNSVSEYFKNLIIILITSTIFIPYYLRLALIFTPILKVQSIIISTGDKIEGGYLLYKSFGKKIVIGDNPDTLKCKDKIILNMDHIISYQFMEVSNNKSSLTTSKIKFTNEKNNI